MNALATHFEAGSRGFGTGVSGADCEGEFSERTRRRPAMASNTRQRAKHFFDRKRHANDTGGADKDLFGPAIQACRSFLDSSYASAVAGSAGGAVGIPGIDDERSHPAFGGLLLMVRGDPGR